MSLWFILFILFLFVMLSMHILFSVILSMYQWILQAYLKICMLYSLIVYTYFILCYFVYDVIALNFYESVHINWQRMFSHNLFLLFGLCIIVIVGVIVLRNSYFSIYYYLFSRIAICSPATRRTWHSIYYYLFLKKLFILY